MTVLLGVPGSGVKQVAEALVMSSKQVHWTVVASRRAGAQPHQVLLSHNLP